jgi:hypothetical protein
MLIFIAVVGLVFAGCGKEPSSPLGQSEAPPTPSFIHVAMELPGPADFVDEITNPWLGYTVGKTFHYESETDEGLETITVEVLAETKTILGIEATIVHDWVELDGELIEDTYDWYAQDVWGNVWYLGEDSKEYEDGMVVSTEGSWEAGVDGAVAGIIMLADPKIGMQYYQEYYEDEAEDEARVLSLKKSVEVPAGQFDGCLETGEWTKLDPGAREFKFYAYGVGVVLELIPRGGRERVELISIDE